MTNILGCKNRSYSSSQKFSRRGSRKPQSSAAPFLVVITLVLVFYIIFLQPADRLALLGEDIPSVSGPGSSTDPNQPTRPSSAYPGQSLKTFVFDGPGQLFSQNRDEYVHRFSSFALRGEFAGVVLANQQNFLLQSSLFESRNSEFSFVTPNPNQHRNLMLSLSVNTQNTNTDLTQTILYVHVNGVDVYSGSVSRATNPIPISSSILESENTVTMRISSPGIAFWKRNLIEINSARITGEFLDTDGLSASHRFDVRTQEVQKLRSSQLRFFPNCNDATARKLSIKLNDEVVSSKVPDCGVINVISLPQRFVYEGMNTLYFESEGGSFVIDQFEVINRLEDDRGVVYNFDLPTEYFSTTVTQQYVCGEPDGVCPSGCSGNLDKDCCFVENPNGYWCATPTQLTSDRCVGQVTTFNVDRCTSGYEDRFGNPHPDFKGRCGDNTDGVCPVGCSAEQDKDCCLTTGSNNHWCASLPIGGVSNICKSELSIDECTLCQTGYISRGSGVSCTPQSRNPFEENVGLKRDYFIIADFFMVDDESLLSAELNINGYRTSFETRRYYAEVDISDYVKSRNNYIQIIPKTDIDLQEVRVVVKRR